MAKIFDDLKAPFDPAKVSWRVGSTTGDKKKGLALAYIDARDVMERLDAVCGPEGWQDSYTETAKGRIICTIQIKIGDEWIVKSDGAGNTDVEGDKGALSDAFKRCAVKWGIGRYLYDVDSPWVAIEPMGKSFKISASAKPDLARALGGNAPKPTPKADAKPSEPPAHAKDAKAIILAAEKVKPDEWEAFYDGIMPRLSDIKTANPETHKFVTDRLAAIEAALRIAA